MSGPMKIGIIGCGNISEIYFTNLTRRFPWVTVAACSDLMPERSRQKSEQFHGVKAVTTDELLADPSIDMILNLTTPELHVDINRKSLHAGKHVYCEKPFALSIGEAHEILTLAQEKSLLTGCAPDTFLGAGIQTCYSAIARGDIGNVVSAQAFMTCHGHESWHPDPEFYYQRGGGPMLDMGPYYLTALCAAVGPVKRVSGSVGKAFSERLITSEKKNGTKIPVNTPTHVTGTIDFANGAIGTVITSFDIWASTLPRIELHGTKGSLLLPDPNTFGGPAKIYTEKDPEWRDLPVASRLYGENSRGIGIADMALAIRDKRNHRASGKLATHVLEVMLAFEESSLSGKAIEIAEPGTKPEELPENMVELKAW